MFELEPRVVPYNIIDGVKEPVSINYEYLVPLLVAEIKKAGAQNLKRIHSFKEVATPGRILAFMESKTVWHPIGV
jgi:hypothetical protein